MPAWIDHELAARREAGLYRRRRRIQSIAGTRIVIHGRELINFSSNDYLNLAGDARLARSAALAARRHGCGARSSPLVSGLTPPLRALERALADWEGTEAALVLASGFAANLAVLTALCGRGDAIFSDELNHASLIDGCRLSRADVHVYRHCDLGHLDELLSKHASGARRRVIVTDTVFSMDGDIAPLRGLALLAEKHDALLVIDEAHATGVLGAKGTGLSELELTGSGAIDANRLVKVGTLSKALGTQGGFICGTRRLIEYLVNMARPYIYSTALAPPIAAAARRAVKIARDEDWRRHRLAELGRLVRQGLAPRYSSASAMVMTPIVPVVVGDPNTAVELSLRLMRAGLLVPAIRPPTVPPGTARLRISLSAGHTDADVGRLLDVLLGES
jgi:8-amino-7-oxononanoate synthase